MDTLTQDEQQRIARLEKYVNKVEEAQAEMMRAINSGEMEGFSEEDVRFYLSHTPNMIAEAGLFLAKMQRAYEYSKVDTKVILAKIWKKCNQHKDDLGLSNARDREALSKPTQNTSKPNSKKLNGNTASTKCRSSTTATKIYLSQPENFAP